MARKMGKMALQAIFGPFFPFFAPFFPFSGPFLPHFTGKAKIHFSAIFVAISARRPEMELYQVHGITGLQLQAQNEFVL